MKSTLAIRAAERPAARTGEAAIDRWGLLVLPGLMFLLLTFGVPLAGMVARSLTDPSPANYLEVVQTRTFVVSMVYTLQMALLVTLACLALGYPWALLMHQTTPGVRWLLAGLVVLPFWSSLLVRTYAWTVLLRPSGIVNQVLQRFGLVDPLHPLELMGNSFGVAVGMTQILLPFMVLPIYAVMQQIDDELLPAAESLGARPLYAFRRVFLPLSLPGVAAGCLLVFVIALGFYITPTVLGSARSQMLSQHIVTQTSVMLNFGLASALAVVLLVVTMALIWIGSRVAPLGRALGYEEKR